LGSDEVNAAGTGRSLQSAAAWSAPLVILVGVWLWLAFSSGGYIPRQWLPGSLVIGLFGLLAASLVIYPRRPRQLSLAVLTLFALYALWVAFSALWADSVTRVWLESARTFCFLLILALALTYLVSPVTRQVFRYLLMAAALVIVAVCVWRLWSTPNVAGLFIERRLVFPVSYMNNDAALFLVSFWPLMWLAAGPEEKAPVRGLALGLATALVALAFMTQSRGAAYSLVATLVLTFIVSPARLRTLLYLLVPAVLLVYAVPNLNRYWLEGPEAVGGGLAARTVLVVTVTASFAGMIVALLERWVRVSRRMRTIFGTVVLLGVLAGAVYGTITVTSGAGGPFEWLSLKWRQVTDQVEPSQSESESSTRFAVVSSNGRVSIWKVAWQEFENEPALGVGADNFIFDYNRLRLWEGLKPQQAHSLELQVLGDTGIVGGVLAFGGMLLALGGILWPRSVAGWRRARETWLRTRRKKDPPGANPRICNPRWGNNPAVYGWEMAIFVGVSYWLVHASVDWLWQMAGVSIPFLLLLAAGVAGVDARADVMWPRLHRWLSLRRKSPETTISGVSAAPRGKDEHWEESQLTSQPPTPDSETEPLLALARRSEQHASKHERARRREARKRQRAARFQPPGLLSSTYRLLLAALSVVVLISAGLPYLSEKYQESALALAKTSGAAAAARAETALWFQPGDPGPYVTQAHIYDSAAAAAAASISPDRTGATLDNIALTMGSLEKAIANEPADWSLHYRAGVASLNLLLATHYATGAGTLPDYAAYIAAVPGLRTWSGLSNTGRSPAEPGTAPGSLATTPSAVEIVIGYRDLSKEELGDLASGFLQEARSRNPLAQQIAAASELLGMVLSQE